MILDRFCTTKQLAGDLVDGATPLDRLATAFHRQTLTNVEGGVDQEEFRVKATSEANKKIEENIKTLKLRSAAWGKTQASTIEEYELGLQRLQEVDIESELETHKTNKAARRRGRVPPGAHDHPGG